MENAFGSMQKKFFLGLALIVIALLLIGLLAAKGMKKLSNSNINDEGYQAVFLTNNQVYFGKMTSSRDWIHLTDIYYLQVTQPLQQTSTDTTTPPPASQPNIQLVKLGNELHGPQDAMFIDRDKVLFWENLKDNSKVVEAINKAKAGQ